MEEGRLGASTLRVWVPQQPHGIIRAGNSVKDIRKKLCNKSLRTLSRGRGTGAMKNANIIIIRTTRKVNGTFSGNSRFQAFEGNCGPGGGMGDETVRVPEKCLFCLPRWISSDGSHRFNRRCDSCLFRIFFTMVLGIVYWIVKDQSEFSSMVKQATGSQT